MKKYSQGFSLIELSIVMVIMGTLFISFKPLFTRLTSILSTDKSLQQSNKITYSLMGFVINQYRLPCPDSNGDGLENCTTSTQTGLLPYKTLHQGYPFLNAHKQPLHYAVYRNSSISLITDSDLATNKNRYTPLLPNSVQATNSNGLDFCLALKNATRNVHSISYPYLGGEQSPLNMAFIIVDPGNSDADNNGVIFDGKNNTGLGFEKTGKKNNAQYDDRVYAMSFTQLSGKLNCSAKMAVVNGAAREAYVAQDIKELSQYYFDLKAFDVDVNDYMNSQANVAVALLAVDGLLAVANTAISIVAGAESLGAALAAIVVPAAAQAALLISATTLVSADKSDATDAIAEASLQKNMAQEQLNKMTVYAETTLSKAKDADAKGLY
ncbi:MAG: prepilin-type N-terminal cleavage/methylation domain-containing protein [Pseudomonadota bacterium]